MIKKKHPIFKEDISSPSPPINNIDTYLRIKLQLQGL